MLDFGSRSQHRSNVPPPWGAPQGGMQHPRSSVSSPETVENRNSQMKNRNRVRVVRQTPGKHYSTAVSSAPGVTLERTARERRRTAKIRHGGMDNQGERGEERFQEWGAGGVSPGSP